MVFYFTATGNSLYAAKQLDKNCISIAHAIHDSDPTYQAEKMLSDMGIHPAYINVLLMVENFLSAFDMNQQKAMDKKVDEHLEMIRNDIEQGKHYITPLPLGAIVTVAGTGSECNGGAVITNEALKVKTGRDYPQCNPEFALMDPTYTYTVPKKQMVSGSFDILSHIMETYFSEPNEDNVSDDISEALMRSVIKNLRAAIQNPEDYTARSNLMWASTMAENRVIKLGKKCDFECHQMEHQLGAYTDCNHGCGLAVLHPVYFRHIYKDGLPKFVQFAKNVWQISGEGKTEEEIAKAGVVALADFIKEIGLPTTF